MIVYDKTIKFNVLGTEILLFDSETAYGWHTYAEIDNRFYFLGDIYCNTEAAINLWQDINGRLLSAQEIWKVYEYR